MTFASDDFDRALYADALVQVDGIWEVKGLRRGALLRYTRDAVYERLNAGMRNPAEIEAEVYQQVYAAYHSVVVTAIIMAVVSFIVRKILEHIFPDE